MMKNCNTSFLLAITANLGFLLFLILEQTILSNWVVKGWLLNALIFLFFLSLLYVSLESQKKVDKVKLSLTLFINLVGFIVFLNYWFRL